MTDDAGASDTDTVIVRVENVAPTVDAGSGAVTASEGQQVTLTAVVSDSGVGDTHTMRWHVDADNGQVLADGNDSSYSFVPADNGTYIVTLDVTDDDGGMTTNLILVTVENVAPIADAGPDQVLSDGDNSGADYGEQAPRMIIFARSF